MSLALPPELVQIIADLLDDNPYDKRALQSCALVARSWATPCQRAVFRELNLSGYQPVVLSAHLIRYPHLQRLIRDMTIGLALAESERLRENYLSCLAALLSLMPCVTSLDIAFDRNIPWDAHDQRFIEAFGTFLRTSESLQALIIRDLQDEVDFQQMFSILEGSDVRQVTFYTDPHPPRVPIPVPFFDPTLTVVHLPQLEMLRIESEIPSRICSALNFWFCQWPDMFPNLKHLEIFINTAEDITVYFLNVLRPAALRLELFRLDLMYWCFASDYDLPSDVSLLEGLDFRHVKLCIFDVDGDSLTPPTLWISWFSLLFRHLADSGTTIHFTELTFTFRHPIDLETTLEWGKLDVVLSHDAFTGVQRIHFEDGSDLLTWNFKKARVTEKAHAELVALIRRTLPCLSSRGVLSFL